MKGPFTMPGVLALVPLLSLDLGAAIFVRGCFWWTFTTERVPKRVSAKNGVSEKQAPPRPQGSSAAATVP